MDIEGLWFMYCFLVSAYPADIVQWPMRLTEIEVKISFLEDAKR